VVAVVGIVIAIVSLAISTAQYRYGMSGIDVAETATIKYSANGKTNQEIGTQLKGWIKGNLYYGINQTLGIAGKNGNRYNILYKNTSKDNVWTLEYKDGYVNKNNTYYGEWYAHSTNGKDKYRYLLTRKNFTNKANTLVVDFMIQW
ncbi:MAG: hypothetical protein ACRCUP_03755, partial [Mycoplasmatales bacterium]